MFVAAFVQIMRSLFTAPDANAVNLNVQLPIINGLGPGTSPASFINYAVIFAFAFVGASALIALAVGGVKYLAAAGNRGNAEKAKETIFAALLGLLLVIAAIAMLYTINPDFVRLRNPAIPLVKIPLVAPPQPVVTENCTLLEASWSSAYACRNEITGRYDEVTMTVKGVNCVGWRASLNITASDGSQAASPILLNFDNSNIISGSWRPTKTGTYAFSVAAGSGNAATRVSSGALTVTDGPCISSQQPTNCGDPARVCSKSTCPSLGDTQWLALIPQTAAQYPISGADTAKFLEAIMHIESAGKINQKSSAGACGLMQFLPPTARQFGPMCGKNFNGMTDDDVCNWLRGLDLTTPQSTVAQTTFCMTSQYASAISNGSCYGGQIRDMAAGYNGGGGCDPSASNDNALATSVSCAGTADCSNRPTLRYECLWNNEAHTVCNTTFNQTRDYVAKFNACYY